MTDDVLCVYTESGGSSAAPRGQQEPDPRAGPDTDGRRRSGWADTAKSGRVQHAMGRADGQGKTRNTRKYRNMCAEEDVYTNEELDDTGWYMEDKTCIYRKWLYKNTTVQSNVTQH